MSVDRRLEKLAKQDKKARDLGFEIYFFDRLRIARCPECFGICLIEDAKRHWKWHK